LKSKAPEPKAPGQRSKEETLMAELELLNKKIANLKRCERIDASAIDDLQKENDSLRRENMRLLQELKDKENIAADLQNSFAQLNRELAQALGYKKARVMGYEKICEKEEESNMKELKYTQTFFYNNFNCI
jgi:chromosome segregation ATPase